MSNLMDKFNEFSADKPLLKERLKGILNNEYYRLYGGCVNEWVLLFQVDTIGYAIFCDWEKDSTKEYTSYYKIIKYVKNEMDDKFIKYTKHFIELETILHKFITEMLLKDKRINDIEREFGRIIYKSNGKYDNLLKHFKCETLIDYLRLKIKTDGVKCDLVDNTNWLTKHLPNVYTNKYMEENYGGGLKGKIKRFIRWLMMDYY